jgi:hypothetical protein
MYKALLDSSCKSGSLAPRQWKGRACSLLE